MKYTRCRRYYKNIRVIIWQEAFILQRPLFLLFAASSFCYLQSLLFAIYKPFLFVISNPLLFVVCMGYYKRIKNRVKILPITDKIELVKLRNTFSKNVVKFTKV